MATRTRKELTITEKLNIIDSLRNNKCTREDIQRKYHCDNSTINRILHNEHKLRNNASCKRKRMRPGYRVRIDKAVTEWYHALRRNNIYVNGPKVREQAIKVAKMLNIHTFEASNGWLWRWQKRENVVFKNLSEKSRKESDVFGGFGDLDDMSMYIDATKTEPVSEPEEECTETFGEEESSFVEGKQQEHYQIGLENVFEDGQDGNTSEPSSTQANKALDTLLQYLYLNGIRLKSLDEVGEHFRMISSGDKTISQNAPKNVTPADVTNGPGTESTIAPSEDMEARDAEAHDFLQQNEKRLEDIMRYNNARDPYSAYGEHVAYRLRTCERDNREIYIAQHNIDNIIFNLSMGSYARLLSPDVGNSSIPNAQNGPSQASGPDYFVNLT